MAKDKYHDYVRQALENDGWTITKDPYKIRLDDVKVFIDLAAERLISATNGKEEIVVEVKTFGHPSLINSFHTAVGQYLNYRYILEKQNKNKVLYLAISTDIYEQFTKKAFFGNIISMQKIKIITVNLTNLTIHQWIK